MNATSFEIRMPPVVRLGYLTQSRLVQRAQSGDTDAHRVVWASNARLAYSVINRFRIRPDLMPDAFQEVQLGISRAIRGFQVERLNEFSTYAFAAMRSFALQHRSRVAFATRLPAHLVMEYYRFRNRVADAPSRPEWFDAREEYLDRDPAEYQALLALHKVATPLEIGAARDEVAPTLRPEQALLAAELSAALRMTFVYLEEREQVVLGRRFGVEGREPETLDQIAVSLGLSKERVRQIQNEALLNLRTLLEARGWTASLPPRVG